MNTTTDRLLALEALDLIDATLAASRYVAAVRLRAGLAPAADTVASELVALRAEVSEQLEAGEGIAGLKPIVGLLRPVARGRIRDAVLARAAAGVASAWDACTPPEALEVDWMGLSVPLAAVGVALARIVP